MRRLFIDESSIKRISPRVADNYSRTFLEGREIVVTVRGTLGGVAVVPEHMKGFNVSREVAVIPLSDTAIPDFVAYAIADVRSQDWLRRVAKGVAYTGINIKDLKRLPIPLPSAPEQQEIARRVASWFSAIAGIDARLQASNRLVDGLPQAILAKAFSGDLVP